MATPRTGPWLDAVKIACSNCGKAVKSHPRRGQPPGSTPASCRSRRLDTGTIENTGSSGIRPTGSPRASPASSATGSTPCWR